MKLSKKKQLFDLLFGLLFLTFSIIIFLSLLTFSVKDNSFFNYNSALDKTQNILGILGSYLSDLLLRTFGIIIYFLPLTLLIWSIKVIFLKSAITWLNFLFLPITILFLSFYEVFLNQPDLKVFPESNSGFAGIGINEYLNLFSLDSKYLIYFETYLMPTVSLITLILVFFTWGVKFRDYLSFLLVMLSPLIKIILFLFGKKNLYSKLFSRKKNPIKRGLSNSVHKSRANRRGLSSNIYDFPGIELLENEIDTQEIKNINLVHSKSQKTMLENVLEDFNIKGEIVSVKHGPIVTLFELKPAPGTKTSTVISLSEDIARSMSSVSSRISAIPGRDAIGIEIPNRKIETVFLRELIDSEEYRNSNFSLPLVLGKNILGKPVIVDLATMPHLLVAGTTGSGKSVGINAMILSLLYNMSPEECRFILIDPKMLELSIYQDIPHLLTEVVTDPKKAIIALKWAVKEMESRYQLMSQLGVRDIESYNLRVKNALEKGEVIEKEIQVGFDTETGRPIFENTQIELKIFPKIVLVVDELADLMITSGREIEAAIQRLSQMARAAGIHLIVATQRPSVDVITGTIKSNFPSRISYQVTSKIDSRTILGEQGGEQLLGKGDLLITMIGQKLLRVHGPFVKTHEVESVVKHLKNQGEPEYLETVTQDENDHSPNLGLDLESKDELYNQAVSIVCREKKASTSFIQRHLQIGYNRAARIIEKMESDGIVSPANHVGRREVLVGKDN